LSRRSSGLALVTFDAGWNTLGQAMALSNYPAATDLTIVKISDPSNLLSVVANKLRVTNHDQPNSVARMTFLHVIIGGGSNALPSVDP